MAASSNNKNKNNNSSDKTSRTSSYNVKINGVLEKNVDTRNKLITLKEKYAKYEEIMSPAIGEFYQVRTLDVKSLTDNKGLALFTYDGNSDYSQNVLSSYFKHLSGNDKINLYSVDDTNGSNFRWGGNYDDYLTYVSDIFSIENPAFTFTNGVLANVKTEYALRTDEVGVIKDLQVAAALNGEITTNPNSYKRPVTNLSNAILNSTNLVTGKDYESIKSRNRGNNTLITDASDTRLGMITSQLYSQALYNGAVFNSTKERGNIKSGHAYITPWLFGEYGNNLSNIFRLSDIARVDSSTGRIRDDFGRDIRIIELENLSVVSSDGNIDIDKLSQIYNDNSQLLILQDQMKIDTQKEAIGSHTLPKDKDFEDREYYSPAKIYDKNENEKVNQRENNDLIASRVKHSVYYDHDGMQTEEPYDIFGSIDDTQFDSYTSISVDSNKLLGKTNRLFMNRKIKTMCGAFCTGINDDMKECQNNTIDTAWHDTWGRGKGRTLLTLEAQDEKQTSNKSLGFDNPYCRSWTYHHQYNQYKDAIRPFISKDEKGNYTVNDIRLHSMVMEYRSFNSGNTDGGQYLLDNTVLQSNGLVKITPTSNDIGRENGLQEGLKRCMFSIENLAWKDFIDGNKMKGYIDQKGPNGGRIMWFPPYDFDFQENVSVDWGSNSFIGRGEKVYTYANTDRTAQLSFTLLIDHPSIINSIGNSEGQGTINKDIDADILRFFAGCNPLKENKQKKRYDNIIIKPTPPPIVVSPEGKTLKFAVFFPNNYSGNHYYDTTKQLWEQEGYMDADWWKYLLFGENVSYKDEILRGYEIGVGDDSLTNSSNTGSFNWARKYSNAHGGQWKYGEEFTEKEKNNGKVNKFYYRTDFDLRQNGLAIGNYKDDNSFGLNSNLEKMNGKYSDMNYSFAEVFSAMFDRELTDVQKSYLIDKGADSGRIEELKNIFENNFIINSITASGAATKQDPNRSGTLATRRGKCVGTTIKERFNFDGNVECKGDLTPCGGNQSHNKDINLEIVKAQRCVVVTIEYNKPSIDNVGNVNDGQNNGNDGNGSKNGSDNGKEMAYVNNSTVNNDDTDGIRERYCNEYEYFRDLKVNDPFVWKSIKDKYKYFDPAFHSMSPEGFNERLNFLHQCTRQGHTYSASDRGQKNGNLAPTAGNLSFGRMPVCILRIGDFIYSRILIQSLNINYSSDGMQWDLNPEGAGVQPMYAKVSMGIVLIGGQAMNTPISRLQNANTFNYYANSGVYDDRADRVTVEDGKLVYGHLYSPSIGNNNATDENK